MPYQWTSSTTQPETLRLWPHRSLPPKGFATFIAVTAALFTLPLISVLGTPVLWGLLPFVGGALWLTWAMLQRSYVDGTLSEEMRLTADEVTLVRYNPRGPTQSWGANPYWVDVEIQETGGPVANYVTLSGAGRRVEIGAFLTPEEREALYLDLRDRLNRAARTK